MLKVVLQYHNIFVVSNFFIHCLKIRNLYNVQFMKEPQGFNIMMILTNAIFYSCLGTTEKMKYKS